MSTEIWPRRGYGIPQWHIAVSDLGLRGNPEKRWHRAFSRSLWQFWAVAALMSIHAASLTVGPAYVADIVRKERQGMPAGLAVGVIFPLFVVVNLFFVRSPAASRARGEALQVRRKRGTRVTRSPYMRRFDMAAYINLWRWADQGIRNIKDTVNRVRGIIEGVLKAGGKLTVCWTQGRYDLVSTVEGLDEDGAMALTHSTGKTGNAHGETLRAYSMDERERILKRVT